MEPTDLIGPATVAEIAGVTPQCVSNWQKRHATFPQPWYQNGNGKSSRKLFVRADIEAWLEATADKRYKPRQRTITGNAERTIRREREVQRAVELLRIDDREARRAIGELEPPDEDGSGYAHHRHDLHYDATLDQWFDDPEPEGGRWEEWHPGSILVSTDIGATYGWEYQMRNAPLYDQRLNLTWAA